jgi:hypothetical protein
MLAAEVFMSEKVVFLQEDRSTTVDAVDALDREIDSVWGLIATIETILRENDDHYARGALALAHRHLDGLSDIRRTLGAL